MVRDDYFTLLKELILQITDTSSATPLVCQVLLQLDLILCNPIHSTVNIQIYINITSVFGTISFAVQICTLI